MPDLFEELTFQMKKRKVDLKPGHFNQTYHYNSFSLGGSANIVGANRFSPILPNLKLYVNGSLDSYTGGIGTQLIRDGNPARSGDLILSFGASVGWGHNSPIRIDMLNQYTPNAVTNNNDFALIYQSNVIYKRTGLSQINASVGLRLFRFTFSAYNDVSEFGLTDGDDRKLTGGWNMGYHLTRGGSIVVGSDIYTGVRKDPITGTYGTFKRNGQLYYEQYESEILLNQGSIFVKITRKNGKFLMVDFSGEKGMFFQNLIHDHIVDKPRFMSVLPNTIMLYFGEDF